MTKNHARNGPVTLSPLRSLRPLKFDTLKPKTGGQNHRLLVKISVILFNPPKGQARVSPKGTSACDP